MSSPVIKPSQVYVNQRQTQVRSKQAKVQHSTQAFWDLVSAESSSLLTSPRPHHTRASIWLCVPVMLRCLFNLHKLLLSVGPKPSTSFYVWLVYMSPLKQSFLILFTPSSELVFRFYCVQQLESIRILTGIFFFFSNDLVVSDTFRERTFFWACLLNFRKNIYKY